MAGCQTFHTFSSTIIILFLNLLPQAEHNPTDNSLVGASSQSLLPCYFRQQKYLETIKIFEYPVDTYHCYVWCVITGAWSELCTRNVSLGWGWVVDCTGSHSAQSRGGSSSSGGGERQQAASRTHGRTDAVTDSCWCRQQQWCSSTTNTIPTVKSIQFPHIALCLAN